MPKPSSKPSTKRRTQRPRSLALSGARADAYLEVLRHLIAVARPGTHYIDVGRLDTHLSFLGPAGSRGTTAELKLDPATGLPTTREMLRVIADHEIALDYTSGRRSAKRDYYEALKEQEVLQAASVEVRLRMKERGLARIEVIHDRLDAASGLLLRYTAHVDVKGRHVKVTDDELPEPTRKFMNLMERHAGADSELAFLLLSEIPGVTVEEVIRGQIGPLHLSGIEAPELIQPVLDDVPGAFVLHLAVERTGSNVSADRCRDPFASIYRDTLSPEAREVVEQKRESLGYRTSKERRLICTPSAEMPLKVELSKRGVKLVVRSR